MLLITVLYKHRNFCCWVARVMALSDDLERESCRFMIEMARMINNVRNKLCQGRQVLATARSYQQSLHFQMWVWYCAAAGNCQLRGNAFIRRQLFIKSFPVTVTTVDECKAACMQEPNCKSVDFWRIERSCSLK